VTLLDDRQFQAFCSAIGFIEVNWAMMEQQLDGWVQLVFVTLENGKRKKHLPRGFGKKSEYLREAFNSIPELRPFSEDAISVLDRADGHADMRHDMTHAVITHMIPKNGKYELVNKKVQRDGSHVSKDVVFDVRGFPMLSEDLVDLAKDAIHLSARLQERFL